MNKFMDCITYRMLASVAVVLLLYIIHPDLAAGVILVGIVATLICKLQTDENVKRKTNKRYEHRKQRNRPGKRR